MIVRPDYIPEGYDRILVVESEREFFATELKGRTNCIVSPRSISGDFNALAQQLYLGLDYHEMFQKRAETYTRLRELAQGEDAIAVAARQVLYDIAMVEAQGADPDLRIAGVGYYNISTYSLHMDGGNDDEGFGTFMCNYTTPTTRWARPEDCDNGFYTSRGGARHFNQIAGEQRHFGVGDMIRQAPERNLHNVEGFIHAAEPVKEGQVRMLLCARMPFVSVLKV